MRLKYQLFITLLVASALLVAIMFLASSLSFSRGFLGYINSSDNERLYSLALELEQQYSIDGGWDNTASDPRVIRSLLRSSGVQFRHKRNNKKANGRRDKQPPPPIDRIQHRLVLANADKQLLLGRIDSGGQPNWQPINQDNEVIGYVGLNRLKRLDNQFDRAFEQQQKKAFALAGLSMVVLSALLAAPLASRIVKPILNVKKTVAQISAGNFAHRITTNRRDEIGDLSADINQLGSTLEKNRDSRRRHFAEISHELRTPVAVLQAEIEALQDGIRTLDEQAVHSLHKETIKLNRLIEDLHVLSLADAGALDYKMQAVNLVELVRADVVRHNIKNTDLTITFNTPETQTSTYINGDRQRLEQLIDNLMQNTLRYTNKPGIVNVAIATHEDSILLKWSDSAPGVKTDALNKLFDPLYREESSRSRENGGSGLGLSIVRKIVEAHNGTCNATHSDLGGLEINLSFPKRNSNL